MGINDDRQKSADLWLSDKTKKNAEIVISRFNDFIVFLSCKYSRKFNGLFSSEDLYSTAVVGLLEALNKHNGSQNFSSYATTFIMEKIQTFIERNVSVVNYGKNDNHKYILSNYSKLYNSFKSKNPDAGRDEIHHMIARKRNCSFALVERVYVERLGEIRFDALKYDDDGETWGEFYADQNSLSIERRIIEMIDCKNIIRKIYKRFRDEKQRRKRIIQMIIDDEKQASAAIDIGISRQAVEQMQKRLEPEFRQYIRHVYGESYFQY